jgi:integrase
MSKTTTTERRSKGQHGGVKSRGIKRAFTKEQVQLIRGSLAAKIQASKGLGHRLAVRELALFETALSTMLRGSDVLSLTVGDVVGENGAVLDSFYARQKKTSKTVRCRLADKARSALRDWLALTPEYGRGAKLFHFSLQFYGRIVKDWARLCHLDPRFYSTHSMRRTFPTHLYQQTKNFAACQHLLGHARESDSSTYLGIDKESSIHLAEEHDL